MIFPVNEIFETIQGEASFTGTPAIFLRLQGCGVGCPWCDTKHTWEHVGSNEIPIPDMLAKVDNAPTFARMSDEAIERLLKKQFRARHVVITGGEPAQFDLTILTSFLTEFSGSEFTVQLETSGTEQIRVSPKTFVTLSPKIGMPGGKVVRLDSYDRANEVKWPIGKQADVDQLLLAVDDLMPDRARNTVWLQPLSASEKATKLCIETATKHGFRLSIQTHKFIGVR